MRDDRWFAKPALAHFLTLEAVCLQEFFKNVFRETIRVRITRTGKPCICTHVLNELIEFDLSQFDVVGVGCTTWDTNNRA